MDSICGTSFFVEIPKVPEDVYGELAYLWHPGGDIYEGLRERGYIRSDGSPGWPYTVHPPGQFRMPHGALALGFIYTDPLFYSWRN